MRILGIESSCDETAVAIYDGQHGLLAHHIYSQVDTHAEYGGVVPELASRDHIRKALPLINLALQETQLSAKDIDGVAYTKGPGLIGALMVGASVARSLAFAWGVPAVGVHHMESHLMAALLEPNPPEFPFVALLVSGGHTMLVEVKAFGEYTLLGESKDDAAGEAFDKTAKLLGLPYPGGAVLAELARSGDPNRFHFPRPMVNRPGMDFSFSGLKTHAMKHVREYGHDEQSRADIAYAFEQAVIDTLIIKSKRALEATGLNRLVVVGGVSANHKLRIQLAKIIAEKGGEVFYPRPEFCTDNAAMVAYNGYLRLERGEREPLQIEVRTRWNMMDLSKV